MGIWKVTKESGEGKIFVVYLRKSTCRVDGPYRILTRVDEPVAPAPRRILAYEPPALGHR